MFRRSQSPQQEPEAVELSSTQEEPVLEAAVRGPWDSESAPEPEQADAVLDLGGLRVTLTEQVSVQVSTDAADEVVGVVLQVEGSELRLQALAAPRSGGSWEELRQGILGYAAELGGEAHEIEGPLGPEVRATLPEAEVTGAGVGAGGDTLVPVRFVGVEGPRWLLRGVITGVGAAEPAQAAALEEAFCATVVVRGGEALPTGALLPLALPAESPAEP